MSHGEFSGFSLGRGRFELGISTDGRVVKASD